MKVIVILLCIVVLLGIMGYEIYEDGFEIVIEHDSSSDVPLSREIDVNSSLPIQKDNYSTKLSVPTVSTLVTSKPKSSIAEADIYTAELKETFRWLKNIENHFINVLSEPSTTTIQLFEEEITLRDLKSIEELDLTYCKLASETDLKYLKCLKNLKKLNLYGFSGNNLNIDFEPLSSLTLMKKLNLRDSGFSDKDLKYLVFLPIEEIILPTAVLTEDGIKTLSTFYHLTTLILADEYQLNNEQRKNFRTNIKTLKKALPNCEILTE